MTLALDPASRTGWAFFLAGSVAPSEYGFFDVCKTSSVEGDWLLDYERQVTALLDRWSPHEIVVEDYFFSRRFATGADLNYMLRAVIYMCARRRNETPYRVVSPSSWFVHVVGRAAVKKQDRKNAVRTALETRFGIALPTKTRSAVSARLIVTPPDIADAIGQGLFALGILPANQKKPP